MGGTDQSDVVEPVGMVSSEILTDESAVGETDDEVDLAVELGGDQVGVVAGHVLDRVPFGHAPTPGDPRQAVTALNQGP
ncbi:MAG: hypothetical protein ABFR89_00300 [Actinomycetota bacterium]